MDLKPSIDVERHPYQMKQQDFYYGRCHDRSLFLYHRLMTAATQLAEREDRMEEKMMEQEIWPYSGYLVQSKIADAREQVKDAIDRTEQLMADLRAMKKNI